VVTGLYPLAQAVEQIGQRKVTVTDVVPAGQDPTTYQLTPAQVATVQHATVVVQVGGGFQPSFEAAAAGRSASAGTGSPGSGTVLSLKAALHANNPYVWLDPPVMARAVNLIAATLEEANPAAAPLYRDGAEGYVDEVNSTGIDYENTLAACPRHTIVTPDAAFAATVAEYDLTDQVVGSSPDPSAAAVATALAKISNASLTTLFSEPFASNGTINAIAIAAGVTHLKIRLIDPLTGPPPQGWPKQSTYITLMESNLGVLNAALGCPNTENGI